MYIRLIYVCLLLLAGINSASAECAVSGKILVTYADNNPELGLPKNTTIVYLTEDGTWNPRPIYIFSTRSGKISEILNSAFSGNTYVTIRSDLPQCPTGDIYVYAGKISLAVAFR